MTDNLQLWNKMGKTDPAHTKQFSRAGGFKGTALKPQWAIKQLTDQFGPCGIGWGVLEQPSFQVVQADKETLVYCTVSAWHGDKANVLWGVGGDKVVTARQSGSFCDDEAFKKAFTDAVMNAFKFIGVGADIHMGLFDDSKYLSEVKQEFAAKNVTMIDDATVAAIAQLSQASGVTIQQIVEGFKVSALDELTAEQGERTISNLKKRIAQNAQKEAA